jgi:hypothetical protein
MSAGDGAGRATGEEPPARDEVAEPQLTDLFNVSLAELHRVEGSPVDRVVARLIEDAADPHDAIAGFNSAVP